MSASASAIKLAFGSELRRVRVNLNTFTLAQLKNLVKATFSELSSEPVIKYVDNEGDVITIKSEAELSESISVFYAEGMKSMKFLVEEGQASAEAPVVAEQVTEEPAVVLEEVHQPEVEVAEEAVEVPTIPEFDAIASFQEHAEPIFEKMEQFAGYVSESMVKAVENAKVEEWPGKVAKAVEDAKVEEWPAKVAKAVEDAKVEEWPAKVAKAVEDAKVEEWPGKVKEGAVMTGEKVKEGAIKTGEKVKEGAIKTGDLIAPYLAEGSGFVIENVRKAQAEIQKLTNEDMRVKAQETLTRVQEELQQFMKRVTADLEKMRQELKLITSTDYPAFTAAPAPEAPKEAEVAVVPESKEEEAVAPVSAPAPAAENKEEDWVIPQQEEVQSVSSESSGEESETDGEVSDWSMEYSYVREVFPEHPKELVVLLLNKHQGNIQLVLNEMMDM